MNDPATEADPTGAAPQVARPQPASRPYVRLSLPPATKAAAEHGASGSAIFVVVYVAQRFFHVTITTQEAAGLVTFGAPFVTWGYKIGESIFRQWLANRKIYV